MTTYLFYSKTTFTNKNSKRTLGTLCRQQCDLGVVLVASDSFSCRALPIISHSGPIYDVCSNDSLPQNPIFGFYGKLS